MEVCIFIRDEKVNSKSSLVNNNDVRAAKAYIEIYSSLKNIDNLHS